MLHIIGRSNNGAILFKDEQDFDVFSTRLRRAAYEYELYIHHYAFMSTHFHLLAWVEKTPQLSEAIKAATIAFHHYYTKRYDYRGHLWHGRFRSPLIASDFDYLQCARYIELNPVHAGICDHPGEFTWSSFRHHALGMRDPLIRAIMKPAGLTPWKDGTTNKGYRDFVLAGIDFDYHRLKKLHTYN